MTRARTAWTRSVRAATLLAWVGCAVGTAHAQAEPAAGAPADSAATTAPASGVEAATEPLGGEPPVEAPALSPAAASASVAPDEAATVIADDAADAEQTDAATLSELGLDDASAGDPIEAEDRFRLYGFLDLGANALYFPRPSIISDVVPYRAPSFVLGNVNLYMDARPSPDWHALVELRFTAYPNGTPTFNGTRLTTISTRVTDVTSSTGRNSVIWGGIVLERAYVEWRHYDAFHVRAGLFLTPYGIWNVDHGTPTLLGLILPTFIADEYLPLRQTGVQADGHFQLRNGELDYAAYVSNGRPQGLFDIDADKAIGGRVRYTTGGSTRTSVGGSFYVGDSETQVKNVTVGMDSIRLVTDTTVAYRDWALAADLSVDGSRFGLRSELVMRNVRYDARARAPVTFGAPGTFEPDSRDYSWYAAPFMRHRRLTSYLWYEYTRGNLGVSSNTRMLLSAGLNVDFTPSVQLKTQVGYYAFYLWDGAIRRPDVDSNFFLATTRLALAF